MEEFTIKTVVGPASYPVSGALKAHVEDLATNTLAQQLVLRLHRASAMLARHGEDSRKHEALTASAVEYELALCLSMHYGMAPTFYQMEARNLFRDHPEAASHY